MGNQAHVNDPFSEELLSRARGCLLGQLAGDSLGGLVEFRRPEEIRRKYPAGLRELMDGGTWDTIAGQPTDDSEMALALARMLVRTGTYDSGEAKKAYLFWLDSGPFDCGGTILSGLKGFPRQGSQANGAMMRISPLGIFGVNYPLEQVGRWAMEDAAITHPNPVCGQANSLFARAIACGISAGCTPAELYNRIVEWAEEMDAGEDLRNAVVKSADEPPADYLEYHGWVIIAFHNALWQLLHAENLESGVVDTVMHGGDTDSNAAICAALLGAVYGIEALPGQWVRALLKCRPAAGMENVHKPRPEFFWPVDAMELAEQLVRPEGL